MGAVGGASVQIKDPEKGLTVMEKAKEMLESAPADSDELKQRSKIVEILRYAEKKERAKDEAMFRKFRGDLDQDRKDVASGRKESEKMEMDDIMDAAIPKARAGLGASGGTASGSASEARVAPDKDAPEPEKRSWKDGLKAAMGKGWRK